MNPMTFMKIQSLGNDFICMFPQTLSSSKILQMCHRHLGIGADGILVLEKSQHADVYMRVYNQDGSEAMICGNGLFCVSEYWHALYGKYPNMIETKAGIQVLKEEDQKLWIGMNQGQCTVYPEYTEVMLGNRHVVFFVEDIDLVDVVFLGQQMQQCNHYPDGVNVEICEIVHPDEIRVKVYERGVGITQSCGSGACAVFKACQIKDPSLKQAHIHMDGGVFLVREEDQIYLHSKAHIVYGGIWYDTARNH